MADMAVMVERAAAARRDAMTNTSPEKATRARATAPVDVEPSRRLTFTARLRAPLEQRDGAGADDAPWHHLCGVASVTGVAYEMWDAFGPYLETVAPDAFTESLARDPDVAFLVNHRGLTMARTVNGTLMLTAGPHGLTTEAWLNPARTDVHDLAIAIDDGCVNQMSFAAQMKDGEWNDDYTAFTMTRLDLHCGDVSAVNYGANPHTSIAARAHRFLDAIDRLPSGAAIAALRHLEARFGVTPARTAPQHNENKPSTGRSLNLVRSALLAYDD